MKSDLPPCHCIQNAPQWRIEARWSRWLIPRELLGWLLDPASLTHRIKQHCRGRFRVRVLAQGWGRPRPDERRALGMQAAERALIRQVQLLCDDEPWVFARSIIPVTTLSGPQRRLARLGDRPLGAFLFADPSMQRGPVELACIPRQSHIYRMATTGLGVKPACIWGRRSVFQVGNKPLLVCEVFLPDLAQTA